MKAQTQTKSLQDLSEALAQPGCALCRLRTDSADRFLDNLLWESVNDPGRRAQIRQAGGFCREHAWRLARPGAALGVAIIMRDVLQSVLQTVKGTAFQGLPLWSLRRMHETLDPEQPAAATAELVARLEPQAACPACVWVQKMERIYLDVLLSNLSGEEGLLTAYESSDGLCLPHFRQALARVRGEEVFRALMDAQRAIWERLVGHLSEFIRKRDHRFQGETWGEERDAWLRAIAALVGPQPDQDR